MSAIDTALAQYAQMGTQEAPQPSILNKIGTQVLQDNQLNQSAISVRDRMRWGFADDFGKQRILMESGYDPSQVVRLRNGDWGIKTPQGIKPVDPKGFQSSDLGGDLAESLGKGITGLGGIVGGSVAGAGSLGTGAAVGVGVGSAGGESIRQAIGAKMGVRDISNLAKLAYEDDTGWHMGGVGEIAAEGILGGGMQKVSGLLANKLAQAGTIRQAVNSADNVLSTGEIKPKVIDAITEMVGLPKGTNKRLLQEFIDPNGAIKYIPHEGAIDEHVKRAGSKIITMVEQGKNIANEIYEKGLKEAGVDTSTTLVPVQRGIAELDRSISAMTSGLGKKEAAPIIRNLSEIKNYVMERSVNGQLPLSELQVVTKRLNDIRSASYINGTTGTFTKNANRPLAAFTAAKNSNPVIAALNKEYRPQLQALKKLQSIMNIRLEEGLYKEGRFTPEMFISRLGAELKDRNLEAIIKADDVLSKSNAFKGLSVKQDLLTALLGEKLSTKAPFTGGRLSASGITDSVSKAVLSPRRRAQMIKGLINTGVFNPKALGTDVSKAVPKLSAVLNMAGSGKLAPATGKVINSNIVKEVTKSNTRSTTQSLNSILYRQQ
jgi:hypothetical protein